MQLLATCGLHDLYAKKTLDYIYIFRLLPNSFRNLIITNRNKLQNKEMLFSFVIYFPFSNHIKALMLHMYMYVGASLTVTKLIFLTIISFICIIYK